jgi:hypothetical protein
MENAPALSNRGVSVLPYSWHHRFSRGGSATIARLAAGCLLPVAVHTPGDAVDSVPRV